MNVKQADLEDCTLLANLNHQLIRDEGHRNRMSLDDLADRMRGWLATEYAAYLFVIDSAVAGYALFRTDRDFVYLRQFFVRPEYRRRGLGRSAFTWLNDNVWRGSRVRIDVLTGNGTAILFWHSLGFTDYCVTMERG